MSLPIRPRRPEGGSAGDRYPAGPRPARGAWSPEAIEPRPRSVCPLPPSRFADNESDFFRLDGAPDRRG